MDNEYLGSIYVKKRKNTIKFLSRWIFVTHNDK